MQGWYTIHQYSGNRMGFVPHTASSNSVPICTTVEACNFSIETNTDQGIGNAVTGTEVVTDVPEWMLLTIGFSAVSVIGLMLVAYLVCPMLLGLNRRKNTYVLNHHQEAHHLKAPRKPTESLESDGLNL